MFELSAGSRIHPTFHVSKLRKFIGPIQAKLEEPPILAQILVQWSGTWPEDSSWVDRDQFAKAYPSLRLADKPPLEGAKDDTIMIEYDVIKPDLEKIARLNGVAGEESTEETPDDEAPIPELGIVDTGSQQLAERTGRQPTRPKRTIKRPGWTRDFDLSGSG